MKSVSCSITCKPKYNYLSFPRKRLALDVGGEISQHVFNYKDNGALDSGQRGETASISEIFKT